MSINNIGTNIPIEVGKGGTGNVSLTANGVLYGNNAAAIGVTAVGTATQLLTSNGGVSAPSFQGNPLIDSGLEFVSTITWPTISTFVNFTNLPAGYGTYLFVVNHTTTVGGGSINSGIFVQLSVDNGATWIFNPQAGPVQANYYQRFISYDTSGTFTIQSRNGETVTPGGFLMQFGGSDTSAIGYSYHYLTGLLTNGTPAWVGYTAPFTVGISLGVSAFYQGSFKAGPITANAFRIGNQGMEGPQGTISIYRIKTV